MANAGWTCVIYGADEDPGTIPYDTVSTATLGTYTGASNKTAYIVAPQRQWAFEFFEVETVGGWKTSRQRRRPIWQVELYPATWTTGGDQDLPDLDDMTAVLEKPFLWIRIVTPERSYPSSASTAHPVILVDWAESINRASGTRTVTIGFQHRGIS